MSVGGERFDSSVAYMTSTQILGMVVFGCVNCRLKLFCCRIFGKKKLEFGVISGMCIVLSEFRV